MIIGIGTDLLEVLRMKKTLSEQTAFKENIFTENEIAYCEKLKYKEQHYAARYAAKEAFIKAIGTGWRNGIKFIEIEIINDDLGKPEIFLSGKAKEIANNLEVNKIHVSISHLKDIANAYVIITK